VVYSLNNEKSILKKIIFKAKQLENEYDFEKVLKLYEKLLGLLPSSCKTIIQEKINQLNVYNPRTNNKFILFIYI